MKAFFVKDNIEHVIFRILLMMDGGQFNTLTF
ncbi:hypothetical protein EDF67_105341 [Sphingobacterium sp. JUb78]|nr:hypothetical protein [Sphingobacterium kitahiroshimense]TCR10069.1 hypothetical protein EDF67_105341 [Sphingobacterium sp. JUb78]